MSEYLVGYDYDYALIVENLSWSSGDGGTGSAGNDGGAGGGGAGGASFGVYCSQSRFNTVGRVETVSVGSAHGGRSAGNAGANGISKNREGCD